MVVEQRVLVGWAVEDERAVDYFLSVRMVERVAKKVVGQVVAQKFLAERAVVERVAKKAEEVVLEWFFSARVVDYFFCVRLVATD